MKKIQIQLTLFTILFFFLEDIKAQSTDTVYFDKQWKEIVTTKGAPEKDDRSYGFYRVREKSFIDGSVKVVDYYKDGRIQMTGQLQPGENSVGVGSVQVTGQQQFEEHKVRVGTFEWFHKNGKKERVYSYQNGKEEGKASAWFDNGVISEVGEYLNGEKHGKWTYYFDTGEKSAELLYKYGKVLKEQYWEKDGTIQTNISSTKHELSFNSTVPLNTFIQTVLNYPTLATDNGVQGTVYVSFVVNRDGSVSNIELVKAIEAREIGEMLNQEALRVVKLTKDYWIPSKIYNRNVDCRMVLPIVFKLY